MDFAKIAPYLKDPLVLIGFIVFLGFLFVRSLVKKGIIPVLQQRQGFSLLKTILLYGFVIGLLIIVLGFGLKYREMSSGEQKTLTRLLHKEFDGNIRVVEELRRNTETFLSQQITISNLLRTKGIKILPLMFDKSNLNLDKDVNTNDLARRAMESLERSGLANNKVELKKLEEFSTALLKTVNSVRETNESLRDSSRARYFFRSSVWQANMDSYRKVNTIDITLFQRAYDQEQNLRNDYEVISKNVIRFQTSLLDFFKKDNEITWDQLAYVLTTERQSYQLIVEYSKNLVNTLTDLKAMNQKTSQLDDSQ